MDEPFKELAFTRTLINENKQIRSACKACEHVIVSSVLEGLAESEATHLLYCNQQQEHMYVVLSPPPEPES
jgi:hypothetical protein